MSNVRRREYIRLRTGSLVVLRGPRIHHSQMTARANPKPRSRTRKVVVLRVTSRNNKSSARAKVRTRTNVAQSMGPQPSRVGITVTTRMASVALLRGLRLELGMQPFPALIATPNPAIARTRSGSAGLALISFGAKPAPPPRAAHVKR